MKRSSYIDLILLGTLAAFFLLSKSNERDVVQARYADKEDCVADWGDEENCTESYHYYHGNGFLGPRYYWDRSLEKPVEVLPDGGTRVLESSTVEKHNTHGHIEQVGTYSKGGFGSTARGFTAGG